MSSPPNTTAGCRSSKLPSSVVPLRAEAATSTTVGWSGPPDAEGGEGSIGAGYRAPPVQPVKAGSACTATGAVVVVVAGAVVVVVEDVVVVLIGVEARARQSTPTLR